MVLSVEDLEALEETLDVMGNAELVADIRESLAELETAGRPTMCMEQARRLISDGG